MIFSETRFPPRIKSGANFFRIMLQAIDTPQERSPSPHDAGDCV
jgi:hypothetical protein